MVYSFFLDESAFSAAKRARLSPNYSVPLWCGDSAGLRTRPVEIFRPRGCDPDRG
jgi:hypothetical protein